MAQRSSRVVVTGGAGFIGSHLVDRLLADNVAQLVVIDNFYRGHLSNLDQHRSDPRVQIVQADIRDTSVLAGLLKNAQVVYHLAAQSSVVRAVRDPVYTFATNVGGTFNILRLAADSGVERVVFASSRQVYGDPISLPVQEDSPLLPINSYGASKAAAEAYCRAFRREFGLQVAVLRLANVYGPRDCDRVIPAWLERARAGQDLELFGGKQVLDFVWIDHVVDALVRAAGLEGPMPAVNVGSGTGTRIIDLAHRIARLGSGQPRVNLQPARPMDVTRFVASVERMRQILQVEPPLDPLAHLEQVMPSLARTV